MKGTFALIVCVALSGCHTVPVAIPEANTKVNFDRRLLEDCPDVPHAVDARDEGLKESGKVILTTLAQCRQSKRALANEVRKMLNIPD